MVNPNNVPIAVKMTLVPMQQSASAQIPVAPVEADGPGVIGDVVFGGRLKLGFAAALPLQSQPFVKALFLKDRFRCR